MTTDLQPSGSVRDALVGAALKGGADQGLRGAEAGYLVRSILPGFSPKKYGVRSLKQYIEKFVPELRIVGYSGVDPVYGLTASKELSKGGSNPPSNAPPVPKDSLSCWRVWVSPRSGRVLNIDRESGEVQVSDANTPSPDGAVRISPAEGIFHRKIAAEFLNDRGEIQESVRSRLADLLADPEDDWWRAWADLLKDLGGTVYSDWMEHRSRMLASKFRQELNRNKLSNDAFRKACEEVRPTRRSLTKRPRSSEVVAGADDLLQVALRILPTLAEEELRAINLPLGKVFDALVESAANQ